MSQEIRAGRAYVELGVNDKTSEGLARAQQRLQIFGSMIRSLGTAFAGVGLGVSGFLTGASVAFGKHGMAVQEMAKRTGIGAQALTEFQYAADQAGVSAESFETGVKRMQKVIGEAQIGTQEARNTLAKLGFTLDELAGKSPEDQFSMIAERISSIADPTVRAASAMKMFGRSGTDLIPMLEGLEQVRARGRSLGLFTTDEESKRASALGNAMQELWAVARKLYEVVGSALADSLTNMVRSLTGAVAAVVRFVRENEWLIQRISAVAKVVTGTGVAIYGVGAAIGVTSSLFGKLNQLVGVSAGAFSFLGRVAGSAFSLAISPLRLLGSALSGLATITTPLIAVMGRIGSMMLAVLQPVIGIVGSAMVSIANAIVGPFVSVFNQLAGMAVSIAMFPINFVANMVSGIVSALLFVTSAAATVIAVLGTATALIMAPGVALVAVMLTAGKAISLVINGISYLVSSIKSIPSAASSAMNTVGSVAKNATTAVVAGASNIGSTVASTIRATISNLPSTLSSVWSTISNSAVQAFNGLTSFLQPVFNNLKNLFWDLCDTGNQAFAGIMDALKSQDMRLAGDILWAGIKLAFAQGEQSLLQSWMDVGDKLRTVWDHVWSGMKEAMATGVESVKNIWVGLKETIQTTWEKVRTFFEQSWNGIAAKIEEVFESVKAKIKTILADIKESAKINATIAYGIANPFADTETTIQRIEAESQTERNQIELDRQNAVSGINTEQAQKDAASLSGQQQRIADIAQAANDQRAENAKNAADRIREIEKQLQDDLAEIAATPTKSRYGSQIAELQQQIKDLKIELEALVDVAAANAPDFNLSGRNLNQFAMASLSGRASTVGTFSASAAFGLGANGSTVERIAKATERSAASLEWFKQNNNRIKHTFG